MTPTQPSQAVERDKFEAWFEPTFDDKPVWNEARSCYVELYHHMAWKGWQERAELARPQGVAAPVGDALELAIKAIKAAHEQTDDAELRYGYEHTLRVLEAAARVPVALPAEPCNVNCAGCEGCCGNLPAEQGDAKDAERLDWLASQLFGSRWNGVIDSGSQTHWGVAPDIRHKAHHMIGNTFRDALDAAILASKPAAGENTSTPADPYGY